ncbi:MAG: agmatinase [Ignisphaera sp.]
MYSKMYLTDIESGEAFLGFNKNKNETPFTILGIPLDMSSSFRGGCGIAPRRIRFVSRSLELCSTMTGIDVESIGFEDVGDVVLSPGDMQSSLKRIEYVVRELLEDKDRILIAIGGEHTITLPIFKSLASERSQCLVVLDAHADLRDEYLGSRYNHATVIRRTIEETKSRIILIGARALSREEIEAYHQLKEYITIIRVWQGNIHSNIEKELLHELESCSRLHISIDMDILDPTYAPGVQTPEPLGLDPATLLKILSLVANNRVRVIDLVEVSPIYDQSDVTSFLAAKIIIELTATIYKNIYGDRAEKYMCRI